MEINDKIVELSKKISNFYNLTNTLPEKQDQPFNLKIWFADLVFKKLPIYRAITTPNDSARLVYEELQRQNFQIWQCPAAEIYILQGDWSFKAPKALLVSDFFPTKKQLEFCINSFIPIELHEQAIDKLRSELNQIIKKEFEFESSKKQFADPRKITKQQIEMNKQLIELSGTCSELKNENDRLKLQIEKLKEALNHANKKGNNENPS